MAQRQVAENFDTMVTGRDEPPPVAGITVLVTQAAFDAMRQETLRYAAEDQETGGIMIGKWLNTETVLVVAATEAGPHADHQKFTFAIDVDFANSELDRWVGQYPGVDYIGEWHKHPPALHYPSGGDLYTARRLLSDPGYPARLINPITVVRNGRVAVNFYYLTDQMGNFGHLQPRILAAPELARLEPELQQTERGPGNTGNVQVEKREPAWYTQPNGLARVQGEEERLEAMKVKRQIKEWESDKYDEGSWAFVVHSSRTPGLVLNLECYGQYPNQPPRVQATYKGEPTEVASFAVTNWASNYWVSDIVRETDNSFKKQNRSSGLLWVGVLLVLLIAAGIIAAVLLLPKDNPVATTTSPAQLTAVAAQNATANAITATFGAINGQANADRVMADARDTAAALANLQATTALANKYATATALIQGLTPGPTPATVPGNATPVPALTTSAATTGTANNATTQATPAPLATTTALVATTALPAISPVATTNPTTQAVVTTSNPTSDLYAIEVTKISQADYNNELVGIGGVPGYDILIKVNGNAKTEVKNQGLYTIEFQAGNGSKINADNVSLPHSNADVTQIRPASTGCDKTQPCIFVLRRNNGTLIKSSPFQYEPGNFYLITIKKP